MSDLSNIVLGLWPIAGVTTIGVTRDDARDTIRAAIDSGVTHFDTAYSYGYDGESDRVLREFVQSAPGRYHIMGKVGQRWDADHNRVVDGSPKQLIADAEEHLQRIGLEQIDLLYLHSPDPNVEIELSAETMAKLQHRGLCKTVGLCNATLDQIRQFASVVPCDAIQCPLNLIQRDSIEDLIEPVSKSGTKVYVFWTLMKGLLAGKIKRDHVFAEGDSRPKYPIFQGDQRRKAHEVIDLLEVIGKDHAMTVAQVSIGWALSQPGVSGVLVGARRPTQITETLKSHALPADALREIDDKVKSLFA
ncbi:aldo/keto reductase [Rhodopirellula sp. MGV]|uniref:aldo/keto reductase n=1 Tax=Rhodopirellula sp. MGV TaxID=2023130 RepID=UPI000B961DEA|nr:aldo/keto reductase [Rhodopirellula sp. MGV]OYP32212.1 general stress protein [Rhodopirellula sp. MGV]PNY35599.1 aldo/keto reductase [Rhodopirellula baltica]